MALGYPTEEDPLLVDEDEKVDEWAKKNAVAPPAPEEETQPLQPGPSGLIIDQQPGQPAQPAAAIQGQAPPGLQIDGQPAAPAEVQKPEIPIYSGDVYPNIAQQRKQFVQEIDNDPRLREFAAAAMSQEAGDDAAYLGAVEALFNRTQQRNSRISKELTNGFYGPVNRGEVLRIVKEGVQPWMYEKFDKAMGAVRSGSDLIEGRTDQGMINEIKGPKAKYGSEYFGYMGGDPSWSMQHQRNKGTPVSVSEAAAQSNAPTGLLIDKEVQPQGLLVNQDPRLKTQGGIDSVISEAESAGLQVTSGYRGPEHPLTKANPKSPHATGQAFDLRAGTGQEADMAMAKQRELFTKRGLTEGSDYKFIDEVRNPSGHATGPHVHVQLTDSGMSKYQPVEGPAAIPGQAPPGLVIDQSPKGLVIDGQQAPPGPAVTSEQLPSGEMAPTASPEQIQAAAIDYETRHPPTARQAATAANRKELQGTIEGLEKQGYTVPHTIGKPDEPEGDRAPTKDMEEVAATLKRKAAYEARTGQFDKSKETAKEADKWEEKVKTQGMSAEQEAMAGKATLGVNLRLMEENGMPVSLSTDQRKTQDKIADLESQRTKLVQTFTPDQTDKAAEIQKLDNQILAEKKAFSGTVETRDKKYTPEELRELVTGRTARKEGAKYGTSLAATGIKSFETSSASILQGTQELQAAATRKQINPYENATQAKDALPTLTRNRDIFKQGIDELNAKLDPSNQQQAKLLEAYTMQLQSIERNIEFANARSAGKSGEGLGAAMHRQAEERAKEIGEKLVPKIEKDWNKFIDQTKKDDIPHAVVASIAGSLPTSGILMATAPISMPVAAVAGGIAIFSQTYNDALAEGRQKGLDPEANHQQAIIKGIVNTPLEELGDLAGAKMFTKVLLAMPPGLKDAAKGTFFAKAWDSAGKAAKELGPTVVAEGLVTNPAQSLVNDTVNEKFGIQAPTTITEKLVKAGKEGALGATSAAIMWGIPTLGVAGAKHLVSLPPSSAEPAVSPRNVGLTGAAAEMGGGQAPFTPPAKAAELKEGEFKSLEQLPAQTAPKEGAPVEPTREVVTTISPRVKSTDGRRGEVVEEKEGTVKVKWEDDQTTTDVTEDELQPRKELARAVNKNVVTVGEHGKKGSTVEYYDDTGNRVKERVYDKGSKEENLKQATTYAETLSKNKNISGYYDPQDNFVRTAAQPAAATVTSTSQPVSQPAPEAHAAATAPAPGVVLPPSATATTPAAPAAKAPDEPISQSTLEEEQTSPRFRESILKFGKRIKKAVALPETKRRASRDAFVKKYDKSKKLSLRDQVAIWHNTGLHKELENSFDYLRAKGSNQGIPIEYTEWDDGDLEGVPAMVYTANGKNVLRVNPYIWGSMIDTARDIGGDKAAKRMFKGLLQEESLHAAENVASENEYNALPPAEKAKYTFGWQDYQREKYVKMLQDMKRQAYGGAIPKNDSFGVAAALKDAYNIYFSHIDEAVGATSPDAFLGDAKDIFDHLITKSGKLTDAGIGFMPEFMRQLNQQRMFGRITEQTYAYISNKVMQWVRNAIRSIRRAMQLASGGRLGYEVSQGLYNIEAQIFTAENLRRVAQYSHVQSVKQGTKEYKEWAGQSILIDKKTGINKTVYHSTQGDFDEFKNTRDLGYHFGTREAAWDRAKAQGADSFAPENWNIMPMTLRLENPVQLPDLGMWRPERVMEELVKNGYMSTKDARWLLDFVEGELTNDDIVGYLQGKEYDGVVYTNRAEGARTLTEEEADKEITNLTVRKAAIGATEGWVAIHRGTGDYMGFGATPEEATADAKKAVMKTPAFWDHSYIVFTANQAKSAAGNEGSYSREDSRITKAKKPGTISMEAVAMEAHNTGGGSSINAAHGNLNGKEFYSVAIAPELMMPVPGEKLVLQDWHDFRDKLMKAGVDPNSASKTIGTWYNKETGNSEFDLSATLPDLRAALVTGQEYNQEAIFDHLTGGTIYVQGVKPGPGIVLPSVGERFGFVAGKAAPIAGDTWPIFKPALYDPYSFNITNLPPGQIEGVKIISDDDIRASAERGQDWRDWYTTYDKYMRWLTAKNPEYRPLYAWWFAATSPHNLVGANITASMKAFRNWIATGDPAVPGPGMADLMKVWKPNLRRATGLPSQAAKEPKALVGDIIGGGVGLTGGKVPEFAPALLNDPYAIAVDMHVASVLFQTEAPTEWQRFAGQMAIMRIAKRMGWKPAEVQAALFADDIMKRKKTLARAEDYMQKYESEFQKLIEADQSDNGGQGAGIGRSILERASKRIGPERFLSTTAGNIESIRQARKEAIEIKVDPELASGISLRGPAKMAAAKSVPTTGTLPAQRKVVGGPMGLNFLYNGVKQVLWNSPGLKGVGNAIHKFQDLIGRYKGEYLYPLIQWESKMWDVPEARPRLRAAANEHQEYREAKAAGMPVPKVGADAKRLIGVADALIAKVNAKNKAANVKVHDPLTGKLVPVPHIDYPSMVKDEVIATMRDPHMHVWQYNKLKDDMITEGILPSTTTDIQFNNYVEKLIKAHDKNDTFNRFFFNPKLLPSTSYDYSYAALGDFMESWTQKLAQREAFGENSNHDIFDIAVENMTDPTSIAYIQNIKAMAYGRVVHDNFGRLAIVGGQFASFKHLAGPIAATKNWLSGMMFTAQQFGIWNFTKAFFLNNPFRSIDDAYERGILTRDIMNVAQDGELLSSKGIVGGAAKLSTGLTGAGYYYSGYKGAENWVRGVSMRGAEGLLRHAIGLYKKNPRGPQVLRYMAYFQRLGVQSMDTLLQEDGKGEATNSYLRAAVNEIQGGYTFADVPAYMETPVGKWLFKYKKWGIEQVKHFVREVALPAARGARLAAAEKITIPDPITGKDQTYEVPRSVAEMLPLARYIVLGIAAGAGQEWLLEKLFGMHPKTMRIADALAQFRESNWEGFTALIDKMWNWSLSVGSYGSLGNFVQSGLIATGVQPGGPQQAFLQALPSLDPFNAMWEGLKIGYEQKGYTSQNWIDLLNQTAFTKGYSQLAATQARDVFGYQNRVSKNIAAKQDLSLIRNVEKRYEEAEKYAKKNAPPLGKPAKDVTSKWRDMLDAALYTGDAQAARQIILDARKGMSPARWNDVEADALKRHIQAKHPVSPAGGGAAARADMMHWIKSNLNPYDQTTIRRMYDTYQRTSQQAGAGIEWKAPSLKDIMEYKKRNMLKAQETTY